MALVMFNITRIDSVCQAQKKNKTQGEVCNYSFFFIFMKLATICCLLRKLCGSTRFMSSRDAVSFVNSFTFNRTLLEFHCGDGTAE